MDNMLQSAPTTGGDTLAGGEGDVSPFSVIEKRRYMPTQRAYFCIYATTRSARQCAVDLFTNFRSLISVHSFLFTVHFLCSLVANQRLVFKTTSLCSKYKIQHSGAKCEITARLILQKTSTVNTNVLRFLNIY